MENQIDAIFKTVSRNVEMLTKLKHFVPENILYSYYVVPYFYLI